MKKNKLGKILRNTTIKKIKKKEKIILITTLIINPKS